MKPAPDRVYDVVVLHGRLEYRPLYRQHKNIFAWVLAGHLDPLYRITVRFKCPTTTDGSTGTV